MGFFAFAATRDKRQKTLCKFKLFSTFYLASQPLCLALIFCSCFANDLFNYTISIMRLAISRGSMIFNTLKTIVDARGLEKFNLKLFSIKCSDTTRLIASSVYQSPTSCSEPELFILISLICGMLTQ